MPTQQAQVRVPLPPHVEGLPEAGPADAARIVWWGQRSFLYLAQRGTGGERAFSTFLVIVGWLVFPLTIAVQAVELHSPNRRYYLSRERDAVLGVVATGKGWYVTDHVTVSTGTGRGRALRALVLPELRAAADAAGIAVYTTAAHERLAAEYVAELPGLVDVGRGTIRGRKLRRAPEGSDQ